jgi:hypothetical protein
MPVHNRRPAYIAPLSIVCRERADGIAMLMVFYCGESRPILGIL